MPQLPGCRQLFHNPTMSGLPVFRPQFGIKKSDLSFIYMGTAIIGFQITNRRDGCRKGARPDVMPLMKGKENFSRMSTRTAVADVRSIIEIDRM